VPKLSFKFRKKAQPNRKKGRVGTSTHFRICRLVTAQASAAHGWAISGRAMEGVPALSQDDKFGSELKFQNRISAREQPIQVPGKPSANE